MPSGWNAAGSAIVSSAFGFSFWATVGAATASSAPTVASGDNA